MERTSWIRIDDLVGKVREYLAAGKPDQVSDLVNHTQLIPDTIAPYRFFSDAHYTRNLIFKNELFELLTLCWSPGQKSWIHNHHGQHCWMMVTEGTLGIRNYKRLGCNQLERTVSMEPTPEMMISSGSAATVDPVEPIHLVWNPQEYQTPAISVHIYSLPFETCVVYDAEKRQCRNIKLFYTTVHGKMLPPQDQKTAEAPPCACVLSPNDKNVHCGSIP